MYRVLIVRLVSSHRFQIDSLCKFHRIGPRSIRFCKFRRIGPRSMIFHQAALEFVYVGFFGSATPCASPPPWPSNFSNYSFWVHPDDRHLLAHAMASDFSVAWQLLSKLTIVFFITDQTPCPVLTPAHGMEFCVGLDKAINH
jgi:hypothetical protein